MRNYEATLFALFSHACPLQASSLGQYLQRNAERQGGLASGKEIFRLHDVGDQLCAGSHVANCVFLGGIPVECSNSLSYIFAYQCLTT